MSDVSKTNKELIEEARRLARLTVARNWGDGGITSYEDGLREMCKRLADALEAATDGRLTQAELEDIAETHAFCADRLFIETELVDAIRAERDAALAAVERCRGVIAEERAWLEHLAESGDAVPRTVIGIGKVEAALENGDDK